MQLGGCRYMSKSHTYNNNCLRTNSVHSQNCLLGQHFLAWFSRWTKQTSHLWRAAISHILYSLASPTSRCSTVTSRPIMLSYWRLSSQLPNSCIQIQEFIWSLVLGLCINVLTSCLNLSSKQPELAGWCRIPLQTYAFATPPSPHILPTCLKQRCWHAFDHWHHISWWQITRVLGTLSVVNPFRMGSTASSLHKQALFRPRITVVFL